METLEYFIDASFDDFDLNSINVSFVKNEEREKQGEIKTKEET